jgi:GxxExxY protein
MEINEITRKIMSCAYTVHTELGPGLLESAYRRCLAHSMRLAGLNVIEELALPITFKGLEIDYGYRMDILVEGQVIVELKAVDRLIDTHEAQVLTYMKFAKKPVGMLINFNVKSLKYGIKRFVMEKHLQSGAFPEKF